MPERKEITASLEAIVGPGFVSSRSEDLFIYSHDSSANEPRMPDYVIMPQTTAEVASIVRLANREKIPLCPAGAGLNLEALTLPVRGGIVMDMRRMDRIIEVHDIDRYALIEAGVTQGHLLSYLERHHPGLQHSVPDAPPAATILGSALLAGYGHLSTNYGTHAEMINAMEVVLPSGEVCLTGSRSLCESWFSRGSLPDGTGLFTGWLGTTGIVTQLSIRLYPLPAMRDMVIYMMQDVALIPEVIFDITHTEMAEDVSIAGQERPAWMKGYQIVPVYLTANSEREMKLKKSIFKNLFTDSRITFMDAPPPEMKDQFLELPFFATKVADWNKGGGFEYAGIIMAPDQIPRAWERAEDIAHRNGMLLSHAIRMVDGCHHALFTCSYPFNRADENSMSRARQAREETQVMALDLGAVPWKPELGGQRLILERMDPAARRLMQDIKQWMDPNNIMNPGNWEVDQNADR